jgi:signal transduction histidine kinase
VPSVNALAELRRLHPTRDQAAAGIAAVAVLLGIWAVAFGRYDAGVRLVRDEDGVVVAGVEGQAARGGYSGLRPGMVVVEWNGVQFIRLPEPVYPAGFEEGYDPLTGESVAPTGFEPERPTRVPVPEATIDDLFASEVQQLSAMAPSQLDAPGESIQCCELAGVYDGGASGVVMATPALIIGIGILVFGAWWLASGRAAGSLVPLALPLAVASAVPFVLRPLAATASPVALAITQVILPIALVPLALAIADRVERPQERELVKWASAACAAFAIALGVTESVSTMPPSSGMLWGLLVGAIAIIPGLAAAGVFAPPSGAGASSGLLTRSELAVAGATPLVAIATDSYPYVFPMALWIGALALAGRFTIRPLARMATRATLQRDLVVAATEAERARVAADIHDDALQELSMLVRRLDAGGDQENAEVARQIADRLRAICGDLRLPILDDLGVGPALDWLVLRIERLAGGEVRLERSDAARPPADVELAFFRVAQEALANAVKHGSPPIVVRYRSTPAGASLSIDDAGPGIAPEAGAEAEREGRFGLLNMQQRAEQIGAILDIRRWPSGGTHVALEWRPR